MVNKRSRREDQDASVIAPNEQGPQPQKKMIKVKQMFRDMADQNREQIHKLIEEKMGSIRPPGCSYTTFLSCQPPEFSGSTDPTAILNWITKMEMTFDCCECEEDKKVKFAVRMLKDDAFSWWNVTRLLLGPEIVSKLTWADFVEKVKERYCSEWDLMEMEKELYKLNKGNMSIDEYACLFTEKVQYVERLARNEKACLSRFVEGLPFKYSIMVRNMKSLNSAIKEASEKDRESEEEEDESEEEEDVGEKKMWEDRCCYRCGMVGHLSRVCQTRL